MQGIPRASHLCELCEEGEVEDLPHFFLRCPRYVQFGLSLVVFFLVLLIQLPCSKVRIRLRWVIVFMLQ